MGRTGYTCLRKTFCWLNILILICGCIFLGAGVWLRLAYQGYASLLPYHAGLSADSLFITVGVLSFVITFFGCCGSWFQSRCLLITYFTLIVLLFLSEFIIGALAFIFRGGLGKILITELKDGIDKHYNASDAGGLATPSVATIWDNIQTSMHCCGVTSYEDWYDISAWPAQVWVPESCCRPVYSSMSPNVEGSGDDDIINCAKAHNPDLWWDKGCADVFQMWILHQLHVVGTVCLVVAFLQLFGLISSMLLFCTMKHKSETHTYKSYSPTIEPNHRQQQQRSTNSYIED